MMGGHISGLVLWLTFVAIGFYVLYVVIRRAVRDGIRDASAGHPIGRDGTDYSATPEPPTPEPTDP